MIQSFLMFLTAENTSQATLNPPPAIAEPAKPLDKGRKSLNFGAAVLGNTIGFGALLAGCWFSLQLMQVFIVM